MDSPIRTKLLECNDSRNWGAQIMRQVEFTLHCCPSSINKELSFRVSAIHEVNSLLPFTGLG